MLKVFYILLLSLPVTLSGQRNVEYLNLYALRYRLQATLTEKASITLETEERRFAVNSRPFQFIAPLAFSYRINTRMQFAQGLAFSKARPSNPYAENPKDITEWRPYQEVLLSSRENKGWRFSQKLRLEERIFLKSTDPHPTAVERFVLRGRLRFQVEYSLPFKDKGVSALFKISTEPQIHIGQTLNHALFDQNQFITSAEYPLNKHISLELSYMNWYQQRIVGSTYSSRSMLRLSLFHKISFIPKARIK